MARLGSDVIEALERHGNKFTNEILNEYGHRVPLVKVDWDENASKKVIREHIEKQIYEMLKNKEDDYYEDEKITQTIKEKYPDLFLDKQSSKELRDRYYSGQLRFSMIKDNPEFAEFLRGKPLYGRIENVKLNNQNQNFSVGQPDRFGKRREDETPFFASARANMFQASVKNVESEKRWLNDDEIIDLALEFGDYLYCINVPVYDIDDFNAPIPDHDTWTFVQKREYIKNQIEERVLNHGVVYGNDAPDFLKESYPDIFISEDAPEELKKLFYSIDPNNRLNISEIARHPEWKPYLEEKNLYFAINDYFLKRFFELVDNKTAYKLISNHPDTINKMCTDQDINGTQSIGVKGAELMKIWVDSTKGKFLPHPVVMIGFPTDEIDNFLANGTKWAKLMQIARSGYDDEYKAALLKAAYVMGLFGSPEHEPSPAALTNMIKLFGTDQNGNKTFPEMTPNMAKELFGSFNMNYDPEFAKLLFTNLHEIIDNQELLKQVGAVQRDFAKIKAGISGIGVNLENALNFVKKNPYQDVMIGNEKLAARCKEAGYSQQTFDKIQELYEKCIERNASSIPRVTGGTKGNVNDYTYEMLRLDDPLGFTIGTMTDCCQQLNDTGVSSMLHSMLSEDGRVFVVRDKENRITAQSWVWRNGDTICFDNIEVPKRLLDKCKTDKERSALTEDVLKVYEEAAKEIMKIDKESYDAIPNDKISKEEREETTVGKITIGLGFNDIRSAILNNYKDKLDKNPKKVISTQEIKNPYTDTDQGQYIIEERKDRKKKKHFEARRIYQDDVEAYDKNNFPKVLAESLLKMEQASGRGMLRLSTLGREAETKESPSKIIEAITRTYKLDNKDVKVLTTNRTALVVGEGESIITIGDVFTTPFKEGLSPEQIAKGKEIIQNQIEKSMRQLMETNKGILLSKVMSKDSEKLLKPILKKIVAEKQKNEQQNEGLENKESIDERSEI